MKEQYELYTGDSFEILKNFADETFDMIFVDPPYMISGGGTRIRGIRARDRHISVP